MGAKPCRKGDPIDERLRAVAHDHADLAQIARVYGILLPLLRDAAPHVAVVPLSEEQALAKLAAGVPLLRDVDLELDLESLQSLLLRLARALEESEPQARQGAWGPGPKGGGASGRRLRVSLESEQFDVGALLQHVAAGDRGFVDAVAGRFGLDAGVLNTLAESALKPSLRAWRAQLAPLAAGVAWNKGSCFVCGARAALGELRGDHRARHLRCGMCGADWPVRRLQCPFCGNEGHATQRFLYAEGSRETQRVDGCDDCRRYVKVIAAHTPTPPELVAVEDLATLHLDVIAERHGYTR